VILDNHSAHISRETQAWLTTQPAGRFAPATLPFDLQTTDECRSRTEHGRQNRVQDRAGATRLMPHRQPGQPV